MFYFKYEKQNNIEVGTNSIAIPSNAIEITEEEYNELLAEFERKMEEEREANKPSNDYGISDEIYNTIIDDYTMSLIMEGVIE